jgi:LysM repeat protein
LHFETRFHGEPFNPNRILDVINHTLLCDTLFISHDTFTKSGKLTAKSRGKELIAKNGKKGKNNKKQKTVLASTGKKKYHVIRAGDNLSGIATKYGMTTTELCRLNGIKKNKLLQLGKKLRVN